MFANFHREVVQVKTREKRMSRRWHLLPILLVALLLPNASALAQTATIPDRLPPDTIFYLHWRGSAFVTGAEKKNHLLQLLEDPDLGPMREAAVKNFQHSFEAPGSTAPVLGLDDVVSLLENPIAMGLVANPPQSAPAPDTAPTLVGVFFVYESAGKTALIQKLKAASKEAGGEIKTILSYDFGGTAVEARTNGTNVTYTAQTKTYYLVADQKRVIEDLITRFRGPGKPASSVTQLPEHQAIRSYIGGDSAIEIFGRIPDFNKWIPAAQREKPAARAATNLHLEKIHAMGGSVSFEGEATRVRGAVLGDASGGSLFDILGPSRAAFLTQPIVYPGPFFSMTRLDLAAAYQLLRAAAVGTLTDQQAAALNVYETMAQTFLGMPVADALRLFTGEFSSRSTFAEDGSLVKFFAVSIQKPQDVSRILRAVAGGMIVGEDTEGDATYFSLSFPYRDPATGQQRRNSYYVAVTPQFLYAGPQKALLREAVARGNSGSGDPAAKNSSADPEIDHLRALLPEKLSGFTGADMARVPWDKVTAQLSQQGADASKKSENSTPPPSWLNSIKPAALSRHLHGVVTGLWKDANGVYFDSYIE
jgi:hypothetical protein